MLPVSFTKTVSRQTGKVLLFLLISILSLNGEFIFFQKGAEPPLSLPLAKGEIEKGFPDTIKSGQNYVPVNLPIKIEFPYSGAKIEDIVKYFSITPQVLGELSFDGKVLILEHEKNLKYNTQYTVTIRKGLALGSGKYLSSDFTFSFTTRSRGEKREFYLGPWHDFRLYTLNYYDSDYELFISTEARGDYEFKLYKSSAEKLIRSYFQAKEYTQEDVSLEDYREGSPIDSQILTLKEGENIFVPKISKVGIYVVEVKQKEQKEEKSNYSSSFLVLTKNAATAKRLGDKLVTWVVNEKTSSGVADAQIIAFGGKQEEVIFQDTTNQQGLLEKVVDQKDGNKKPSILEIKTGDDVSFNFLNIDWGSNIYSEDSSNVLEQYRGYIYTDRPIYTPGDKVNFKAILRENDRVFYKPIQKETVVKAKEVEYGESGNIIFEKKFWTNQNGSLAGSFDLSREIKSGDYEISVELAGQILASARFNIEFYQKPDFEISISPDKEKYIKGEQIRAQISSNYFFGEPLKGEKVNWRVYSFNRETLDENESTLDSSGKTTLEIPTQNITIRDYWYGWDSDGFPLTIEASITDKSGKVSTKTKTLTIFDSEYKISLVEPEILWNLEKDKNWRFVANVEENVSGNPKNNLPLKIIFKKFTWDWENYKEQEKIVKELEAKSDNLGKSEFEMLFTETGSFRLIIETKDSFQNAIEKKFYLWVSRQEEGIGQSSQNLIDKISILPDKKSYKIGERAKIKLELPRPMGDIFWSLNKQAFKKLEIEKIDGYQEELDITITQDLVPGFWFYVEVFQDDIFVQEKQFIEVSGKKLKVEIMPSKDKSGPGEEIELTLKTKNEENVPVSAESSLSVIDKAIFSLKSDQTADIYDAFYPKPEDLVKSFDSFRVISIFRGGGAEWGGCFLAGTKILMSDESQKDIEEVKTGDYILTKESEFSKKLVSDRVTATFEHLVEEYLIITHQKGILKVTSIHPILVNDIWKSAGEIKTGDILSTASGEKSRVVSVEEIKNQKPLKVYNFQTEKYHTFFADGVYVHNQCDGKGGDGESCPVRSNFVDTAYWNAYVLTNKNGEAKVKFKLPDNLTTWVALAKTITQDTKAGQGKGEFKTSKDLIIRPVLPQFFRTGDKIYLTSSIHNNLAKATHFKATLKAEGATILDDGSTKLTIKSIKNIQIPTGQIKNVSWEVEIGEQKFVKLTFMVEEIGGTAKDGVELTLPVYSNLDVSRKVISGSGMGKFEFSFDPEASKTYSSAVFSLNPSVLAVLPEVLEKLTGYPYGCVEQTMSRHLPNVLVYSQKSVLGIEPKGDFQKNLTEGFDRLARFQHLDGGFGWWETDANNVWMSGYVLEGLYEAKQAGLLGGREGMYARLLEFLKSNVGKFSEEEQVYIYYVLSKVEAGSVASFVEKFADELLTGKSFDIQSKGYIALALYHNGNIAKAKLVLAKILEELKDDHWEMPDTHDYHGAMKDRYSATGVNLMALVKIGYQEKTAGKIIQWLMNNRTGYEGLWGSTRQSAQILYALVEYLKKTSELAPDFVYDAYLNDKLFKSERVTNNRYALKLEIPSQKMEPTNTIEIRQKGKGNIYWSLILNNYLPREKITDQNPNLKIARQYLDFNNNPVSKFGLGDLIKVRLTVSNSQDLNYVILEDFLSSAFEVQNPRLENVSGKARAGNTELGDWYDALDIRDQKVAIFRRELWPGTHNFEYLARVNSYGDFQIPSSRVELMYSPEQFAIGQSHKISIKPDNFQIVSVSGPQDIQLETQQPKPIQTLPLSQKKPEFALYIILAVFIFTLVIVPAILYLAFVKRS